MKKLSVADFFCGAGGFSEGFRQMGYQISFALDNWGPAIDTHSFNHLECSSKKKDILELDTPQKIDQAVPDVDVLIGSPPCVAFSGSNRAGKADKTLGMLLIEAYLKIVAWKMKRGNLKYWVLENVPNASRYIKDAYTFSELGLPGKGELKIPTKVVLDAAEYGAPQNRKRFFCGNFPIPKSRQPSNNLMKVKDVFESLGNPKSGRRQQITDPVYGFSIGGSNLTDHFYDSRVADFEWKNAKRLKKDHGFMGRMSFPEDTNRPSRTVMATMSASTRESMIFGSSDEMGEKDGYRLPTIREIACFMSFPITYQFVGKGISTKYKLVGNAVCVKMAAALAESILQAEGIEPRLDPNPHRKPKSPPFVLDGMQKEMKKPRPRNIKSRFRIHVPYLKIRSFRVDLDNLSSDFDMEMFAWKSVLHHGTGKKAKSTMAKNDTIESMMTLVPRFKAFKDDLLRKFVGALPGPKEFQLSYCRLADGGIIGPEMALEMVRDAVDRHFPGDTFGKNEVSNQSIGIGSDHIPLRILAALYACNVIAGTVMSTF